MWDSREKGAGMWDPDPPSRPCAMRSVLTREYAERTSESKTSLEV